MEEKKQKKGVITLVLIFAVLFGYVFMSSFFRTGGCGGGPGPGSAAPAFSLPYMQGGQVSLEQYKGKVLVLNFWASWCPPCRKELPSLMSLHKKFKDHPDFAMLAVSCDEEGESAVQDLFKRRNVELPVALDTDLAVAEQYGVAKFPETFFLDREGKIAFKFIGPRDWTERQFIEILNQMLDK